MHGYFLAYKAYTCTSNVFSEFTAKLLLIYYNLSLFTGAYSTPRLSTPIQNATVTIIDAQGGAGEFIFVTSSTLIDEVGSPLAQATINRTKGSSGSVTVQLTVVEARADGSTREYTTVTCIYYYYYYSFI